MFVYSVLSVAEWLLSSLLAPAPRPRRARALWAPLCSECARAISADLSPQILIYLHYFNGGIVGGCPLSRADADSVQWLWEMPVHPCWSKLRARKLNGKRHACDLEDLNSWPGSRSVYSERHQTEIYWTHKIYKLETRKKSNVSI